MLDNEGQIHDDDNEYLDLWEYGKGSAETTKRVHSDEPIITTWMRDELAKTIHEFEEPAEIEGDYIDELPKHIKEKVQKRQILLPEDCDIPIPPPPKEGWTNRKWGEIPITECNEPLMRLIPSHEIMKRFGVYSAYVNQNHKDLIVPFLPKGSWIRGADVALFARTSVAETLYKVATYLPPGLKLFVLDAHRPPEVQNSLFEVQVQRLMEEQKLPEPLARMEAQKFVSKPSIKPPAPHSTGAAVDVAIYNHIRGSMLNFGTLFDDMSEAAFSDHFKKARTLQEKQIRLNRRYLYWLMRIGNFRGWPFEWWHFDHADDQVGAYISGKNSARYGYIHRPVSMWIPGEYDFATT